MKTYEVKDYIINKNNINLFIEPEWHRRFRPTQIRKITEGLLSGKDMGEVITVNLKNNFYRVINGNHRIVAINNVLTTKEDLKIRTTLHIYKDLTLVEEKEVYHIIAQSIGETKSDKLKAHANEIPILQMIQTEKDFPCNVVIYNVTGENVNTIHISGLLDGYLIRKQTNFNFLNSDEYFSLLKQLDKQDYGRLKNFMNLFIEIFGSS